jgi:hypothetical protein
MKTTTAVIVAAAALLVPISALADDGTTPAPATVANATCTQLKASLGAETFAKTYGTNASKSNAFGKCVAAQTKKAGTTISNALQSCKAQQASDPTGFAGKYGSNGKSSSNGTDKNALGKCVSAAVKQSTSEQTHAITNAAKTCKAALKASATAFAAKYGSTRDAFAKCVAQTAKTK